MLLPEHEYERLDAYCRDRGHKKSTLVARLIRQYLDMEGYGAQAGIALRTWGAPESVRRCIRARRPRDSSPEQWKMERAGAG
ncbi:MAG TPA: hypothetical protein VGR35_06030, partial [Tepidisphaeraceae bacterium]|nr:hypothetical protein [Tepidisphaeraceae bacterium]